MSKFIGHLDVDNFFLDDNLMITGRHNWWPQAKNGIYWFKDTLKAFGDFKNNQKSPWSNVFWYIKVCIFWKCSQYTIHSDRAEMLKKFLRTK